MGFLKEFKDFAVKGNAMDLAVGVIIGAAFGKIVASVVDDLVMPLINPVMPKGGWQQLVIYPGIRIGSFMAVVLNFLIIAFALFLIVSAINRIRKKK